MMRPSSKGTTSDDTGQSASDDGSVDGDWTLGVMTPKGQVTVFQIIPTKPDGNCMYRAISQAISGSQKSHFKCRQDVVDYICDDLHWPKFSTHIKGQNDHLVEETVQRSRPEPKVKEVKSAESVSSAEDTQGLKKAYRDYMLKDGAYGTLQEFIAASDLLQFNVMMVRELSPSLFHVMSYQDTWDTTHHFLFTGDNPDDGHFEFLRPISSNLEIEPKILLEKGYYKIHSVDEDAHALTIEHYSGPLTDDRLAVCQAIQPVASKDSKSSKSENSVDINANLIPAAVRPPSKSPTRTSSKDVSWRRVLTDSDEESVSHFRRAKNRASLLKAQKQCFQNRVHPNSSDSSAREALLPRPQSRSKNRRGQGQRSTNRRGQGQRSPEPEESWNQALLRICCCSLPSDQ